MRTLKHLDFYHLCDHLTRHFQVTYYQASVGLQPSIAISIAN